MHAGLQSQLDAQMHEWSSALYKPRLEGQSRPAVHICILCLTSCSGVVEGRAQNCLSTDRFVGLQMIEPKVLGGDVFDTLAADVRGCVQQYNLVRHALFKFACVHGLQSRDAKRVLIDKQAQTLEEIIAQFTQMVSTSSSSSDVVNMLGQFEMAAIASILGKRSESINLLAHDFIVSFNKFSGTSFPSRFESICADELKARAAELLRRPHTTVHGVEQYS